MPLGCLLLKILNMFYIKQGRAFVLMYGKDVFRNSRFCFFFNWDSLHVKLNSHYKVWSYKKKKHKKITA